MPTPDLEAAIAEHGAGRRNARAEAARHTKALQRLAPRAIAAGMPRRKFARLARISRTTLNEWLDGR